MHLIRSCICARILSQWGYFLNVDGSFLTGAGLSDLWDTAVRGADFYRIAPYVDAAHFISVPVLPNGDPDCYVTACQHSMMRNMNRGRSFVGGIYWGRFVYNDLYAWISPCEAVASMAASGASGYASYGMCGLDDGGVLHRMPEAFCRSLEEGKPLVERGCPETRREKSCKGSSAVPVCDGACRDV